MSAPDSLPFLGSRYTVLAHIGAGGMGRVYLAHDTKHERRVAIKVLDPDYARLVGTQRFMREIQIASGLTHPNIVPLYDSGEFHGQLFYVMPFIEGETLRHRIEKETMLPVRQVLEWAAEVADALAFAHAHGIVHRDIKPENLLIQADHLLIADFGIARAIDLAAGDNITSEQLVLGTPTYMSPEQASGAKLDGRTDVYSLGCVVYEMLTGEPPFRAANPQAVTAKKLAGHYPAVRVVRPTVPPSLDQALSRALATVPADRFGSATEFASSLRGAARPQARHVSRWLLLTALVASAIALAVISRARRQPTASSRQRVAVALFENHTGNPQHDPLGFMAADWVTEGLQRTGAVDVVPTLTALAATRFFENSADTVDPVLAMARETGANLVVTGAIYQDQDSLVFQAQLANPAAGRLVGAVEPLRTSQTNASQALQELRARLMGLLALSLDDRVIQAERPPVYAAYQAFSEGMDAYVQNNYLRAIADFRRAYATDTSFVIPLLYASFCYTNRREYAPADSVLRIVERQRNRLSILDRYWLDYQKAELAGNDSESLDAIRRAAELAPYSKAPYNFAVRALEARLPFPAESALRRLSPDIGPMRGWVPYWDVFTMSLHAQAKHRPELTAAREALRRYPDRASAYIMVARALAALRKTPELERLWNKALQRATATPLDDATLALEVGSELWAHGDSSTGQQWFARALKALRTNGANSDEIESNWVRARAAARHGDFHDAFRLGEILASTDTTRRDYYFGFLGVVAGQLGKPDRAEQFLQRLAEDRRPYSLGEPQFQAGRIAAVLGDVKRATQLFVVALDKGYPYDLEFHRDPALKRLRGEPAFRQLDARSE